MKAETGWLATSWPNLDGLDYKLRVACDRVWIGGYDDTVTAFDPLAGALGTPIDISVVGFQRISQTSDGCWVVFGSPGEFPAYRPGTLAQIDSTGIVRQSPPLRNRIHIAEDSFWASTMDGLIWRIDPLTGQQMGHRWQLPEDDLPSNPKLVDWRLMSVDGQLYLLTAASLYHLDIPTDP